MPCGAVGWQVPQPGKASGRLGEVFAEVDAPRPSRRPATVTRSTVQSRRCLSGSEPGPDGCGAGMYYNTDTDSCEPWVAPNVYVNPVYAPIPNLSACVPVTGRRGHVSGSACVG